MKIFECVEILYQLIDAKYILSHTSLSDEHKENYQQLNEQIDSVINEFQKIVKENKINMQICIDNSIEIDVDRLMIDNGGGDEINVVNLAKNVIENVEKNYEKSAKLFKTYRKIFLELVQTEFSFVKNCNSFPVLEILDLVDKHINENPSSPYITAQAFKEFNYIQNSFKLNHEEIMDWINLPTRGVALVNEKIISNPFMIGSISPINELVRSYTYLDEILLNLAKKDLLRGKKSNLDDILIQPVQRLPRYQLLLIELSKSIKEMVKLDYSLFKIYLPKCEEALQYLIRQCEIVNEDQLFASISNILSLFFRTQQNTVAELIVQLEIKLEAKKIFMPPEIPKQKTTLNIIRAFLAGWQAKIENLGAQSLYQNEITKIYVAVHNEINTIKKLNPDLFNGLLSTDTAKYFESLQSDLQQLYKDLSGIYKRCDELRRSKLRNNNNTLLGELSGHFLREYSPRIKSFHQQQEQSMRKNNHKPIPISDQNADKILNAIFHHSLTFIQTYIQNKKMQNENVQNKFDAIIAGLPNLALQQLILILNEIIIPQKERELLEDAITLVHNYITDPKKTDNRDNINWQGLTDKKVEELKVRFKEYLQQVVSNPNNLFELPLQETTTKTELLLQRPTPERPLTFNVYTDNINKVIEALDDEVQRNTFTDKALQHFFKSNDRVDVIQAFKKYMLLDRLTLDDLLTKKGNKIIVEYLLHDYLGDNKRGLEFSEIKNLVLSSGLLANTEDETYLDFSKSIFEEHINSRHKFLQEKELAALLRYKNFLKYAIENSKLIQINILVLKNDLAVKIIKKLKNEEIEKLLLNNVPTFIRKFDMQACIQLAFDRGFLIQFLEKLIDIHRNDSENKYHQEFLFYIGNFACRTRKFTKEEIEKIIDFLNVRPDIGLVQKEIDVNCIEGIFKSYEYSKKNDEKNKNIIDDEVRRIIFDKLSSFLTHFGVQNCLKFAFENGFFFDLLDEIDKITNINTAPLYFEELVEYIKFNLSDFTNTPREDLLKIINIINNGHNKFSDSSLVDLLVRLAKCSERFFALIWHTQNCTSEDENIFIKIIKNSPEYMKKIMEKYPCVNFNLTLAPELQELYDQTKNELKNSKQSRLASKKYPANGPHLYQSNSQLPIKNIENSNDDNCIVM